MKKFTLLLALLLCVATNMKSQSESEDVVDITYSFDNTTWSGDLSEGEYPQGLTVESGTVRKAEYQVVSGNGDLTITFDYITGNHALKVLGVDFVNEAGKVVSSDYHIGTTGDSDNNNSYTIYYSSYPESKLTLRYFVNNVPNGNEVSGVNAPRGTVKINGESFTLLDDAAEWSSDFTNAPSPWSSIAEAEVPQGVADVQNGGTVYMASKKLILTEAGEYKVEFDYTDGTSRLDILGVSVIDANGNVVASDYHFGHTGNVNSNNVYSVNIEEECGIYTICYYVNQNGDCKLNATNGKINETFNSLNTLWVYARILMGSPFVSDAHKEDLRTAINTKTVAAFTAAIAAAKADFYVSSIGDFNNNTLYTFTAPRGTVVYVDGVDNVASTVHTTASGITVADDNKACQWAVYKSANDNYYLYNIAAAKFMGYNDARDGAIPFVEAPTTTNFTFKATGNSTYPIMFLPNNKGAANHSGSFGDGLINWAGGADNTSDAGNIHQVKKVAKIDDATLARIETLVDAYEKGEYTLTVGSAGYATLYFGYALEIPENVEVYYVAGKEDLGDLSVHLEELTGDVIPANTGVIVKADADTQHIFNKSTATSVALEDENQLAGTTVDSYIPAGANTTYYILAMPAGATEAGLYPSVLQDQDNGKYFYNNANKAYLPVSVDKVPAGSAGLRFEFGTTGIENVESAVENNVYYDLSGRRVENPVKGIYIVNGKKVLVK